MVCGDVIETMLKDAEVEEEGDRESKGDSGDIKGDSEDEDSEHAAVQRARSSSNEDREPEAARPETHPHCESQRRPDLRRIRTKRARGAARPETHSH
jgi:hypothetical protein